MKHFEKNRRHERNRLKALLLIIVREPHIHPKVRVLILEEIPKYGRKLRPSTLLEASHEC